MWTIVQFALHREGDYVRALDLLAEKGFLRHRSPRPRDCRSYPAATLTFAAAPADPAALTRRVFAALAEAGLAPVAVMASPLGVDRASSAPRALAQA